MSILLLSLASTAVAQQDSLAPCVFSYPLQEKALGLNHPDQLWPDGIVTYYLNFDRSDHGRRMTGLMRDAVASMNQKTNTCWVEKPHGKGAVQITNSTSTVNSASLGYPGPGSDRSKILMLNESKGIGLHEMGHVLGLLHEQQRPDRDKYVKINFGNISDGRRSQFDYANYWYRNLTMPTPYDYRSVMHYHPYSFSKNKKPTISLPSGEAFPSEYYQRDSLSELDVAGINAIYSGISREACTTLQEEYRPTRINIGIEVEQTTEGQAFCLFDEVEFQVIPEDNFQGTNKYSWYCPAASQTRGGGLTYSPTMVRSGKQRVELTVKSEDEIKEYVFTVNIQRAEESVTLHGNVLPPKGTLRFRAASEHDSFLTRLVSASGRVVYQDELRKSSCIQDMEIATGTLPQGLYVLQVKLGDKWIFNKLVVQ